MSVLDAIVAGVREDVAVRRAKVPLAQLQQQLEAVEPALDPLPRFRAPQLSVIAEVKRRSPSKGALAQIDAPAELAAEYEAGGAATISVLTERRRFGGSLDDLDAVRARVDIPVLRKDFMIDEYQFFEARAHGADVVLLIVAALDDAQLAEFLRLSHGLGLTPLVEVHTVEEADRALAVGAELIGVNHRNLKTLEVDLATFAPIAARLPEGVVVVAESGITTVEQAARLAEQGADAVLVGEGLVTQQDPRAAVRALAGVTDG